MGLRGPKPKGKVRIKWSPNFTYAIGLIVSDGHLSKDGRHVCFVSKDKIQVDNYLRALKIKSKISKVKGIKDYIHYRVQFSDVIFYEFLESIGIMNAKSKVIGEIKIPNKYFFDFVRGLFDGDGYSYSYWDKRWASSFMFYIGFTSASPTFISWLQEKIKQRFNARGHVTFQGKGKSCFQLKYAKKESVLLVRELYKDKKCLCLSRKRLKIGKSLSIMGLPPV